MPTQLQLEGPELEPLLARVRAEHGAGARIATAEKVRTGGVGGFFAKSHFEITVELDDAALAAPAARAAATAPAPAAAAPAAVPAPAPRVTSILDLADEVSAVERGAAAVSTESTGFASVLARLGATAGEGAPAPAAPRPTSPQSSALHPATAHPAAAHPAAAHPAGARPAPAGGSGARPAVPQQRTAPAAESAAPAPRRTAVRPAAAPAAAPARSKQTPKKKRAAATPAAGTSARRGAITVPAAPQPLAVRTGAPRAAGAVAVRTIAAPGAAPRPVPVVRAAPAVRAVAAARSVSAARSVISVRTDAARTIAPVGRTVAPARAIAPAPVATRSAALVPTRSAAPVVQRSAAPTRAAAPAQRAVPARSTLPAASAPVADAPVADAPVAAAPAPGRRSDRRSTSRPAPRAALVPSAAAVSAASILGAACPGSALAVRSRAEVEPSGTRTLAVPAAAREQASATRDLAPTARAAGSARAARKAAPVPVEVEVATPAPAPTGRTRSAGRADARTTGALAVAARTAGLPVAQDVTKQLAGLGLPAHLQPLDGGDLHSALVASLGQLPVAPRTTNRAGSVVVVVGPLLLAQEVGRQIASELSLPRTAVVLAGAATTGTAALRTPHDARTRRAAFDKRDHTTVVVVDTSLTAVGALQARAFVDALEPVAVWGVVEATRKPRDVGAWSEAVGSVDALALVAVDETADPASVLELGIPVGRLGSRRASAAAWATLLTDRVAA